MGQYFKAMNFDKKETCYPTSSLKLMEWSYQGDKYLQSIIALINDKWKGDRVLVVGDYVNEWYEHDKFKDIFKTIKNENKNIPTDNIYKYDYKSVTSNPKKKTIQRYIYNHELKQYIDLKKQTIQWINYDINNNMISALKIHPLPLLISCSGGYIGTNADYVGSWVNTSNSIELTDEILDKNYTELEIIFDEAGRSDKSNREILIDYLSDGFNRGTLFALKNIKFDNNLFLTEEEKKDIINSAVEKINSKGFEKEVEPDLDLEKE